ncbi:hypothetical protein BH10CYA1_BH10CYA1_41700 [soil metagenome]
MKVLLPLVVVTTLSCLAASAQNWRTDNPDQPNGYHASEAASHYHGNYNLPAQQQNGYRASEARSHYGGSRFQSSDGWGSSSSSDSGWGSRWNNQNQSSRPGSRWNNQNQSSGWGSRWSDQNQSSSWGQTTPREENFARGVLRRMAYRAEQNTPASIVGQPDPGIRYSATGGLLDSSMTNAESSVQRMIRSGGGFDKIYAE